MDHGKEAYVRAVKRFNSFNGFEILLPLNEERYTSLIPYTETVNNLINDVRRYEIIRRQGFSDDHLATEIGLVVFEINRLST
jgi:hypothetical protein